jgi:hypothetical protein
MANANPITTLFADLPKSFPMNETAMKDSFKQWAAFNEKLAGIVLDATGKSADIYAQATKDAIAVLRDATKARSDVAEYATAVNEMGTAQVELTRKNVEAFGEVVQKASGEATELFAEAGKTLSEQSANTTKTVQSTVRKVAASN